MALWCHYSVDDRLQEQNEDIRKRRIIRKKCVDLQYLWLNKEIKLKKKKTNRKIKMIKRAI